MKEGTGGGAYVSWTRLWKQCLGVMMAIIVLLVSMMAGALISDILFHAVEL